jgi:hypothetical protein
MENGHRKKVSDSLKGLTIQNDGRRANSFKVGLVNHTLLRFQPKQLQTQQHTRLLCFSVQKWKEWGELRERG